MSNNRLIENQQIGGFVGSNTGSIGFIAQGTNQSEDTATKNNPELESLKSKVANFGFVDDTEQIKQTRINQTKTLNELKEKIPTKNIYENFILEEPDTLDTNKPIIQDEIKEETKKDETKDEIEKLKEEYLIKMN